MSQEAIALPECSSESPTVVREDVRQKLSTDIDEFLKAFLMGSQGQN